MTLPTYDMSHVVSPQPAEKQIKNLCVLIFYNQSLSVCPYGE